MDIIRAGTTASGKGPGDYFSGDVRIDPVITAPDPARLQVALVTFEPGSRTAWHTHPIGQTLIITSGAGLAQTEGGPIQMVRQGDVIWFAPGEKHWHGAAPATGMSHFAMQEAEGGKAVDWLEQVSDAEYAKVSG